MKIYPYLLNTALKSKSNQLPISSININKTLSPKNIIIKSKLSFSLMTSFYEKNIWKDIDLIWSFYNFIDRNEGKGNINFLFEKTFGDIRKERELVCDILKHYNKMNYDKEKFKVFKLKDTNRAKICNSYFPLIYLADISGPYRLELRDKNNNNKGIRACNYDKAGSINLGSFIDWQIENNSERIF